MLLMVALPGTLKMIPVQSCVEIGSKAFLVVVGGHGPARLVSLRLYQV